MPRFFTALFILLGLASSSQAQQACLCGGGTRMSDSQISTLLGGNTVCAIHINERWQEWHSGGSIFELGNDPNGENVGTWSVSGGTDGTVTYNYGPNNIYTYSVCTEGQSIHFCGATNVTNASVKTGKGGC